MPTHLVHRMIKMRAASSQVAFLRFSLITVVPPPTLIPAWEQVRMVPRIARPYNFIHNVGTIPQRSRCLACDGRMSTDFSGPSTSLTYRDRVRWRRPRR